MTRRGRAKERREKRLEEITRLRKIPYTDSERWWSLETVAVVTGSNRGIGYEIGRQLASHGLTIILTSRDTTRGYEAMRALQEEGLHVAFHQLDIIDADSVKLFAEWIVKTYGGLDILVNNAGANFNIGSENSVEFAENVVATNYFGTKRMIETMIPLMKPSPVGSRIVNVSSRLGRLNGRRNGHLRCFGPQKPMISSPFATLRMSTRIPSQLLSQCPCECHLGCQHNWESTQKQQALERWLYMTNLEDPEIDMISLDCAAGFGAGKGRCWPVKFSYKSRLVAENPLQHSSHSVWT